MAPNSDIARMNKVPAPLPAKPASAESIAFALTAAIVEHRLAPGTQLKERQLGEIFGVSRTLIREALIQLERVKLVTMRQSAGAFVATPTVEEAHQVFAVRRMLETEWLREWVPRSTPAEVKRLRAHMMQEKDALRRSDVARRTRLLGDFHVEIARISGNTVLVDLTRELVARSSLILLVYQSWLSATHSSDEHKLLVDAIAAKNLPRALELAGEHLRHVEHNVVLAPRRPLADLHEALRDSPSPPPRRT
jgi:DNA-binding GntR family transcriptional regulator